MSDGGTQRLFTSIHTEMAVGVTGGGGGMGRVAEEMATTIEVSFLNIPALSE